MGMTSTGGFVGKLMRKESSVLVKVRSKALSGHLESYNKALEAIAELDRKAHPETEAFVWDFDLETGLIDLIEVYPSSIAWYKHYKDGEERGLYAELQNHIDFEH